MSRKIMSVVSINEKEKGRITSVESLMGCTFYFDTNIFRNSCISDAQWHEFQRLTSENNIRCAYPPRLLIEALSNICSNKKHTYPHWKNHLGRLREVCLDNVLRLEDYAQAVFFKIEGLAGDDSPADNDWNELRDVIVFSENYEDSLRENVIPIGGGLWRVRRTENDFRIFRTNYETVWIDAVNDTTRGIQNLMNECGYSMESIVESPEFKLGFLDTMIKIAGVELHKLCEEVLAFENHFFALFRDFALQELKAITSGWRKATVSLIGQLGRIVFPDVVDEMIDSLRSIVDNGDDEAQREAKWAIEQIQSPVVIGVQPVI